MQNEPRDTRARVADRIEENDNQIVSLSPDERTMLLEALAVYNTLGPAPHDRIGRMRTKLGG